MVKKLSNDLASVFRFRMSAWQTFSHYLYLQAKTEYLKK